MKYLSHSLKINPTLTYIDLRGNEEEEEKIKNQCYEYVKRNKKLAQDLLQAIEKKRPKKVKHGSTFSCFKKSKRNH